MSENNKLEAVPNDVQFDETERAAFLLDKEHPATLQKVIKKLRPGGVSRLLFNIVMYPFHQTPMQGKDEQEALGYVHSILKDKQLVSEYAATRNEELLEGEENGNENNTKND